MEDLVKYRPQRDDSLLLVIDIQERLYPAMSDGATCLSNTKLLTESMAVLGCPVVVTEQYPQGLGATVQDLQEPLQKAKAKFCEKRSFTAFTPEVQAALEESGRKHIIVCGMETHVCVWQTCRDLLTEGYYVHLIADAVSSRKDTSKQAALASAQAMGAVINVSETLVFDLLGSSAAPEFKAISALVKQYS